MTSAILCFIGVALVMGAVYLLTWAICAAGAAQDDWDEQNLGIRRS